MRARNARMRAEMATWMRARMRAEMRARMRAELTTTMRARMRAELHLISLLPRLEEPDGRIHAGGAVGRGLERARGGAGERAGGQLRRARAGDGARARQPPVRPLDGGDRRPGGALQLEPAPVALPHHPAQLPAGRGAVGRRRDARLADGLRAGELVDRMAHRQVLVRPRHRTDRAGHAADVTALMELIARRVFGRVHLEARQ
eukprot:gene474-biopygen2602